MFLDLKQYLVPVESAKITNYKAVSAYEIIIENKNVNDLTEFSYLVNEGRSVTDSYKYMENVRRLYNSLLKEGYKETFREILQGSGVQVSVSCEMEFMRLNGGNHRFFGALFAGIDKIPVNIVAFDPRIFERWQEQDSTNKISLRRFLDVEVQNALRSRRPAWSR